MEKPYLDVELFCCSGGMGEGFRRAGVNFDLMIEIEEVHCDSYEANLGHRPVTMDARSFLELLNMGWRPPKPVRMLVADPPCTPWSRAGKRMGADDPRDMLEGTTRIIAALMPQVYLIGNVPGLDDGPNLPIVQRTIGGLSKHGYCTADFARLDAANYGVPQHRVRPFWFGHLKGSCIQWPAPTHCDPADCSNLTLPGVRELLPWVSCAQALGHLSPEELGRPIKIRHRAEGAPIGQQNGSSQARGARAMAPESPKGKRNKYPRTPQSDRMNALDEPSATVTRNGGRAQMGAASTLSLNLAVEAPMKRRRKPEPEAIEGAGITVRPGDHAMSRPSRPARTLTRNTHSDGAVIVNPCRTQELEQEAAEDNAAIDAEPAFVGSVAELMDHFQDGVGPYTINDDERGYILANKRHPAAKGGAPAPTMGAKQRGQGAQVIVSNEWTWPQWTAERPSTTIQRDERIAPPGHHGKSFMSDADAVVISEKAAAILQGFPEGWIFCGESKKARWSQIGQAMPPPLAHAVATSVVGQIERTTDDVRHHCGSVWWSV